MASLLEIFDLRDPLPRVFFSRSYGISSPLPVLLSGLCFQLALTTGPVRALVQCGPESARNRSRGQTKWLLFLSDQI